MVKNEVEKLTQRGRNFELPGWGVVKGNDEPFEFVSIKVGEHETAKNILEQILDAGVTLVELAEMASRMLRNKARPSIDDLGPVRDVVNGLIAAKFGKRAALLQALAVPQLAEVAERYGITPEAVEAVELKPEVTDKE